MNVIWDPETTKKVGNFVSEELDDQDFTGLKFCEYASFHRNTLRNLLIGKPGITFETVIKGLLALEESLDALLLDFYPNRIINLKKKDKKEKYIKSVVHFCKKQSITKEEFSKLADPYWLETF